MRQYARASRSLPAFAAAYGEFGSSGQSSVHEPDPIEPYTSSVDTCTTRSMPARRQASSSAWVPSTLVMTNGAAPATERSTWDSAAKCTTASCPGTTSASSPGSQMSPCTKDSRSCPIGRLSVLPAYVSLSSTVTRADS